MPAALQAASALPLWRSVLYPSRTDVAATAMRHLLFLPAREVCPDVARLLAASQSRSLESVAAAAQSVLSALVSLAL